MSYWDLTKPRLLMVALITAMAGFYLASPTTSLNVPLLVHAMLGIAFVGASCGALNQWIEHRIDAQMERTKNRPLPSGKVAPRSALWFGSVMGAGGLITLFYFVNTLTGLIALLTLVSYLLLYTPLKRQTRWNTLVGAVPGALPSVMGATAAGNQIGPEALSLFVLMFFWQMPHFFSIAWTFRDDYRRGGFRMLSVTDMDGRMTVRHIIGWTAALFLASFVPSALGVVGMTYLFMAIFFGTLLLGLAFALKGDGLKYARAYTVASIVYISLLSITLIVDKV